MFECQCTAGEKGERYQHNSTVDFADGIVKCDVFIKRFLSGQPMLAVFCCAFISSYAEAVS